MYYLCLATPKPFIYASESVKFVFEASKIYPEKEGGVGMATGFEELASKFIYLHKILFSKIRC